MLQVVPCKVQILADSSYKRSSNEKFKVQRLPNSVQVSDFSFQMLQNTMQMKDVSSKMQKITYLSFKMQRIAVKTTNIRNRHTIQRVINQKGFATPGLAQRQVIWSAPKRQAIWLGSLVMAGERWLIFEPSWWRCCEDMWLACGCRFINLNDYPLAPEKLRLWALEMRFQRGYS